MQSFSIEPLIAAGQTGFGTVVFWCAIGMVAGALARLILPGDQKMSWLLTMLLGIGGALIGGFITPYLTFLPKSPDGGTYTWVNVVVATLTALILLVGIDATGVFKKKS